MTYNATTGKVCDLDLVQEEKDELLARLARERAPRNEMCGCSWEGMGVPSPDVDDDRAVATLRPCALHERWAERLGMGKAKDVEKSVGEELHEHYGSPCSCGESTCIWCMRQPSSTPSAAVGFGVSTAAGFKEFEAAGVARCVAWVIDNCGTANGARMVRELALAPSTPSSCLATVRMVDRDERSVRLRIETTDPDVMQEWAGRLGETFTITAGLKGGEGK